MGSASGVSTWDQTIASCRLSDASGGFFQIAIVVLVAAGAGVERGAAISMARQTGLHRGDQNVLCLGAGAGLNVTTFAFHGAMRAVRELAALEPRVALGLALHVAAGHAIHRAHHTVAGGLVAVAALAPEQVLLRIPGHAVQPAAALATGARSLPSGRRASAGFAASAAR